MINMENKKGIVIKELLKEGDPTEEILKVIKEENIDLVILLAHGESRFEHFLFGRSNEDIIRKIPVLMKSTISIGSIVSTLTKMEPGKDIK